MLFSDFSFPEELEAYSDSWGENVIGKFSYFPLRIAPNCLIDGKDYFVHRSALPEETTKVNENDKVTFEVAQTQRGSQAQNVKFVTESETA